MKQTCCSRLSIFLLPFIAACQAVTPGPMVSPSAVSAIPTVTSTTVVTPEIIATHTLTRPVQPSVTISPSLAAMPQPTPTTWQPVLSGPPQNIILIVADSLRPDHISSYGYQRDTTPNLDRLIAQEGVRFTNAFTTSPWTCPSVAAMLSGQMPGRLGTGFQNYNPSLPNSVMTLSESLRSQGYYTSGFVSTYCNKGRLGFSQGFDHYNESLTDNEQNHKPSAEDINGLAVDWLTNIWIPKKDKQPLFLFLYYFDTHDPYDPPPPYDMLYDPGYTGPITPEVFGVGHSVITGELKLNEEDLNHVKALYDGEIAYWDAQLAILLAFLDQQGMMENTLLVITSDHGEHFGENDAWVHGYTLYDPVLRVPLLMRYSGAIQPGLVIADPVQNYDLAPTILDWAGIQPPAETQASSLRGLSTGLEANPARPVFSEVDSLTAPNHPLYLVAPRTPMYSIVYDGWKLIHHNEKPGLDELYQLNDNTLFEADNVIAQNPDQVARLLPLLQQWFNLVP